MSQLWEKLQWKLKILRKKIKKRALRQYVSSVVPLTEPFHLKQVCSIGTHEPPYIMVQFLESKYSTESPRDVTELLKACPFRYNHTVQVTSILPPLFNAACDTLYTGTERTLSLKQRQTAYVAPSEMRWVWVFCLYCCFGWLGGGLDKNSSPPLPACCTVPESTSEGIDTHSWIVRFPVTQAFYLTFTSDCASRAY